MKSVTPQRKYNKLENSKIVTFDKFKDPPTVPNVVFMKLYYNEYKIKTLLLCEISKTSNWLTPVVKYSKTENLKIIKFDTFEDPPQAWN